MVNLCDKIAGEYTQWLRENITVTKSKTNVGDIYKIVTPFLDRHNDYLEIYLYSEWSPSGEYILTDDGYTLSDIEMSAGEFEYLETILKGFGVTRFGNELKIKAHSRNLAQKTHSLIQAMLAVNAIAILKNEGNRLIFP